MMIHTANAGRVRPLPFRPSTWYGTSVLRVLVRHAPDKMSALVVKEHVNHNGKTLTFALNIHNPSRFVN